MSALAPAARRGRRRAARRRPAATRPRGGRNEALRGLAAVDEVLREPAVAALSRPTRARSSCEAVRTVIERLRARDPRGRA